MNLSDAEARMLREALETGLTASRNDDDSIEISLALAMLDAKAECNCHAHSWEEHTDECAACNGMGYKSILIQKDNPLHVPDCPICHGTGKPSQGEGDK